MVPLSFRSTSFSSSERTRMLSSLWMSGVAVGGVPMTGSSVMDRGSARLSQAVAPVGMPRPIHLCKPATRHLPGGAATFSWTGPFPGVPRFYFDVLDGDQVLQDLEGIDFADRETAIAEAVAGARDLVAHGIMQNQDLSGQTFIIRDNHGETVSGTTTAKRSRRCHSGALYRDG